jgi:hypothetical protein
MLSINAFGPVRFASLKGRKAAVDAKDTQTQLQTGVNQPAVQAFLIKAILPGFPGHPAVTGKELLKEVTQFRNTTDSDPDSETYGSYRHSFEDILKNNFARQEVPLVMEALDMMESLGLAERVKGSLCHYPEAEYANQFVVKYALTDLGRLAVQ